MPGGGGGFGGGGGGGVSSAPKIKAPVGAPKMDLLSAIRAGKKMKKVEAGKIDKTNRPTRL
jgi:hypothetical protein